MLSTAPSRQTENRTQETVVRDWQNTLQRESERLDLDHLFVNTNMRVGVEVGSILVEEAGGHDAFFGGDDDGWRSREHEARRRTTRVRILVSHIHTKSERIDRISEQSRQQWRQQWRRKKKHDDDDDEQHDNNEASVPKLGFQEEQKQDRGTSAVTTRSNKNTQPRKNATARVGTKTQNPKNTHTLTHTNTHTKQSTLRQQQTLVAGILVPALLRFKYSFAILHYLHNVYPRFLLLLFLYSYSYVFLCVRM